MDIRPISNPPFALTTMTYLFFCWDTAIGQMLWATVLFNQVCFSEADLRFTRTLCQSNILWAFAFKTKIEQLILAFPGVFW